jgi:hypothetical protein
MYIGGGILGPLLVAEPGGIGSMWDEKSPASDALRQRRTALSRWENEGGSGPRTRLLKHAPLYPLRFEPDCQYRPWGGRRLTHVLSAPLPVDGPVGEAWLLSDRAAAARSTGRTLRSVPTAVEVP